MEYDRYETSARLPRFTEGDLNWNQLQSEIRLGLRAITDIAFTLLTDL